METEVGIVYRSAIAKLNVITDLEAETIPIVVFGNNVLEKPPVAVLDEDSAGEIAIDVFVVVAVAVEHQVFHGNVVHVFSSKDRENSRSSGICVYPKVLFGQPVQEDNVLMSAWGRLAPDGGDGSA
jgi:hypothetical protein